MERERRKAVGHLRRAEFHAQKGDAPSTRAHCARAVRYAPAFGESELRVVQIADRIANKVHVKLERLRSASVAEKAAAAALLVGGAGLLYHAQTPGPVLKAESRPGQPVEPDFAEPPSSLARVGIANPGVLCYMIASIQLLYSMSSVRDAVSASNLPALTTLGAAFRALGEGSHFDMSRLLADVSSDLFDGFRLAAADGVQGASDEFICEFLRWMFASVAGETAPFALTEVTTLEYAASPDTETTARVPFFPHLAVPPAGGTVQEAIRLVAEPETLAAGTDARTKRTEYRVGAESKYVVVPVRRLAGRVDPGVLSTNLSKLGAVAGAVANAGLFVAAQRVVAAALTPEPIRLNAEGGGEAAYALVGAVLAHSSTGNSGHYTFVRTLGVNVVCVYDDGQVHTSIAQRDLSAKATVLLYQRLKPDP